MTTQLEEMAAAFIEALYFTEGGPDNPDFDDAELSEEAREDIRAECHSFFRRFGCYLENEGQSPAQMGHDFWLTRNGHGAGFWDGDWPIYGDTISKASEGYGQLDAYLGDDGLIYF